MVWGPYLTWWWSAGRPRPAAILLDGRDAPRSTKLVTLATTYEDKPSCLFSHDFNDDSLVALAVELGVENLLPGAEIEFSVGDRDDDLVMNDQRFEVSVSIVFAGLMMLVILPEGSERFQPLVDVFDEAAFIVVDVDSGSDVHGGDQDHAVFNA